MKRHVPNDELSTKERVTNFGEVGKADGGDSYGKQARIVSYAFMIEGKGGEACFIHLSGILKGIVSVFDFFSELILNKFY